MTERSFHPFAVLHFLRKTILLYLLPLLQVLFARNWAALRTALVQGAALLAVIAAVSAAVLHTSRWQVDVHRDDGPGAGVTGQRQIAVRARQRFQLLHHAVGAGSVQPVLAAAGVDIKIL